MAKRVSVLIIAVSIIIDRLTKIFAVKYTASHGARRFLFGAFNFTYVENKGAAFSSFSGNTVVLTVITSAIVLGCLVYLFANKSKNKFVDFTLALIISGGIGNLIDRISKGYVVDFIEPLFINFAVFNFADCCITVGAFALAIYEIVTSFKHSKKSGVKTDGGDGDAR